MTRKPIYHMDDDDESAAGDDVYEECEVCHQEYEGTCPIGSADCPYEEFKDDDDDDDLPDFEDVENLDELIGEDDEVEKIIDDDAIIPAEDLVDDFGESGDDTEEDSNEPVKTIEELEAEEFEAAKNRKRAARKNTKK